MSTYFLEKSNSFMKMLNKIGPKIDPLDIARITFSHSFNEEPTFSRLYLKKILNHSCRLSLSTYAANLTITGS